MQKPFVTGLVFGAGLAIALGVMLGGLNLFAGALEKQRLSERPPLVMGPGQPTVVRTEPTVRNGQLLVLVTVRNEFQESIFFRAEAVILDQFGEYHESCPALREFHVAAGQDFHFTANCPIRGMDQAEILNSISGVEIQFFRT
jgi:hypothetical protein